MSRFRSPILPALAFVAILTIAAFSSFGRSDGLGPNFPGRARMPRQSDQQPQPSPAMPLAPMQRQARWHEDMAFLTSKLSAGGHTIDMHRGLSTRGQRDFGKVYPTFKADIAALDSDVPKLSDGEVILRLMKIIASANIAHNGVVTPEGSGFASRLPIAFNWYSDGLAVAAASADYRSAIGTHVLKMGGRTPEEVLAGIAPYISHDNEIQLKASSMDFLRLGVLLDHLGLLDENKSILLTLQKANGEPFTLAVPAGIHADALVPLADALHPPTPLWLSRLGTRYWHIYLADSRTLFVQYNACENDPKLPFRDFAKSVLDELDSQPVERVVIDMRLNNGGDSRVISPLTRGLAKRIKKIGRLYVLVGPGTFSSALDNAASLHDRLHATLAGESTSGTRSGYGEVKTVTLPNSKLALRFTSKWWGSHDQGEKDVLVPEIKAPSTLDDDIAGRDPVLEAVLGTAR